MKSKSTVEASKTKLSLDTLSLKRKSLSTKSSKTSKPSMSWEPPKVRDSAELLRDLDARNCQERLIEVLERSVVSDHGTHLESNGLLLELVKWVTITEPSKTRKSIESVKDLIHLTLQLNTI